MIITTVCIDNHYDTRNGVVVHTHVYVIMLMLWSTVCICNGVVVFIK